MDLDLAIAKHTEWKTRLLAAITNNETLDTATIAKDNCCDLGKWLHGDARVQFGTLASHANCVTQHAKFHIEASKVAAAINTKKIHGCPDHAGTRNGLQLCIQRGAVGHFES